MSKEEYSSVIEALHECMEACNHCYTSCLNEEDVHHMTECIKLDRECADICSFFEQALTRNTPYVKEWAQLCIRACNDCAEECSKHDHQHCKQCADACKRCAEECQTLIS